MLVRQEGSVAVLFAVFMLVLAAAMGCAIDFAMAYKTRSKIQGALDAATLAAARNGEQTQAQTIAGNQFKANSKEGNVTSFNVRYTKSDVVVSATAGANVKMSFLPLFGLNVLPVAAKSEAKAPRKLKSVKFIATDGQGWWEKTVKLMVLRPGSTTPVEIANVHYIVSDKKPPDKGTIVANPTGWVDLGNYTYAYLEMTIGPRAFEFDKWCPNCPKVIRSDDPSTSDRIYVDGKQMPKGKAVKIFELAKCGETTKQAWEDGGGGDPDILYSIESTCDTASSGDLVRLTQ
jgi:hypothetical protein